MLSDRFEDQQKGHCGYKRQSERGSDRRYKMKSEWLAEAHAHRVLKDLKV